MEYQKHLYPVLSRLEVLSDNKAAWKFKDEIMSTGKPGDIIKVTKPGKDSSTCVYLPEQDKSGFYYFWCDAQGNLDPEWVDRAGAVQHSNMFFDDELEIVGHRDVEEKTFHEFKWLETGIEQIDVELANVDSRSHLFQKYAPARLKTIYDEQEHNNFHKENQEMVSAFAEHVASGGSPETFSVDGSAA